MGKCHYERALVTGASSGIGAAAVRAIAGSGRTTLAIARRSDRLRSLADETGCEWISCSVRDTRRVLDAVGEFNPDIVVNNAGVGHGIAGLSDMSPGDICASIETNVLAPIQITAQAVRGMKRRNRGHVVNIGSIAGLHTMISSLYGATKSAMHRFSQNLRVELAGTSIRVTEICPGRVASEFYEAASGNSERLAGLVDTEISALQPVDIARAILFALDAPIHVNVSTIEILPVEQAVGGVRMTPLDRGREGER